MIRLLLLLVFLSAAGLTAAWLAEHPGSVTIYWFDYRIDTSFAFLLLAAAIVAVGVTIVYGTFRRLALAPLHISQSHRLKKIDKGIAELTYSVAALAASDIATAEAHTRKAEKLLGNKSPITLLLSAQIARSKGDETKTKLLLERMLEFKETEYLAARSLSDAASKQQQFAKALALAERAQKANPQGNAPVVNLHLRLGQWQQALHAIKKAGRRSTASRAELRRQKGIVHLQHSIQLLADGYPDAALASAHTAARDLGEFPPASLALAKAYAAVGKQPKALKLLMQSCRSTPHPQTADFARSLIAGEPPAKQAKLLNALEACLPIDTTDASWVCHSCGHAQMQWSANCPQCNDFDTFQWKRRELSFVT